MATLDNEKDTKKAETDKGYSDMHFAVAVLLGPYIAVLIDQMLKGTASLLGMQEFAGVDASVRTCYRFFFSGDKRVLQIYGLLLLATLFLDLWLYLIPGAYTTYVDTMQITDDIEIPKPVGNGQCGNARFATQKEVLKSGDISTYTWGKKWKTHSWWLWWKKRKGRKGGLVIAQIDKKKKETWAFVSEDIHTITLGATRAGKNRRVIFRSICLSLIAGECGMVIDMKGENWTYTHLFAREKGFRDYNLDFREPEKGMHYNFLQPILDAIEEEDMADAIDSTWDLVSVLVGETKGEPIWNNGECATIAAGILVVALEAPEEFRNMTNVYYFLAFMCQADAFGGMPFTAYLQELPDTHPAKGVFAMAGIAPEKTRGSFFSSALGTLRHFTNPKVAEMTSKSDFRVQDLIEQKSIIYLIVPDEKKTLYPLVTVFMEQMSMILSREAVKNGGRLPIDWNMWGDEFGQFPCMPNLPSQMSVQAGRGIRWHLFIQSYQQMEDKYEKNAKTIKDNSLVTVYLKSPSEDTNKAISARLGKYTVQVKSTSASISDSQSTNINYSNSANMQSRSLLEPDEVELIKTPYLLYMDSGYHPAVMRLPDIADSQLNVALGMGDKEHNRLLTLERAKERQARKVGELNLWGIWKRYQLDLSDSEEMELPEEDAMNVTESRISFL